MRSEEIREVQVKLQSQVIDQSKTPSQQEAGLLSIGVSMLAEIAAQLAQLNEGFEYITNNDRAFRVQVEPGQYAIRVENGPR